MQDTRTSGSSPSDSSPGAAANELRRQVLADRFDVVDQPLSWRCRSCAATVSAPADAEAESDSPTTTDSPRTTDGPTSRDIARLAESAADHAMYCGRCDD